MLTTAEKTNIRSSEIKVLSLIADCFLEDENIKPIYKHFLFKDQCFWATNGHVLLRLDFPYSLDFQEGVYEFDQVLLLHELEVDKPWDAPEYPDLPKVFTGFKEKFAGAENVAIANFAGRYLSLLGAISQEIGVSIEFALKGRDKPAFFEIENNYKGVLIEGILMPLQIVW